MNAQSSKRRWWQFRLRTLLIAVLVLSLPLGWLSWRLKQAADQRRAVGAFRDAGGLVGYDYGPQYERDLPNSPALGGPGPAPEPPWPEWLRDRVGDDFFFGIKEVNFPIMFVNPPSAFPTVTDELLVDLKDLRGPRELQIHSNRVTDEGLRILPELPTLRQLALYTPNVTDAGLSHVSQLWMLEFLALDSPHVTNEGLGHLSQLRKLQHLNLVAPNVTDAGLRHLSQLRMLESLTLDTPDVTDAGLGNLSELRLLRYLNLGTPNVTDAGLVYLEPLKQLKRLSLRGTKVTDAGVAKLRQSLPDTQIFYKFDASGRPVEQGGPSRRPSPRSNRPTPRP